MTALWKKAKNPELFTHDEAMASPHHEEFIEAMDVQVKALIEKDCWFKDLMSNTRNKITPSQFMFIIKLSPEGEIK